MLLYILIAILLISCIMNLMNKKILNDNYKLILLVLIIILHLKNNITERFGIFKSDETNEIKDNGTIFYEDPLNTNFIKPDTGKAYSDLPYLNNHKKLALFGKNKCSPECCPSQYSCDRGCICMNEDQKDLLYKHGGNQSI